MRKKKELYRGAAAIFALLFIVATYGGQVANSYSGRINTVLGISTSKIVNKGSSKSSTYYKSDYGNDIYNKTQLKELESDAAKEEISEVEEGCVLLKNENNVLPLKEGSNITLFGQSTIDPFYSYHSTTNSMQELISYESAMKSSYNVNQTVLDVYKNSGVKRVKDATNPVIGEAPSSIYTDKVKSSWKSAYNDAAVVMLTRQGSEDSDLLMKDSEGISQLALHQNEKDMLQMLKEEKEKGVFKKIIVLLNSNSAMETGWLSNYDVDACLWIGTPGIVGFTGVVNILKGDANPSGHLVDTYATNSLSAPAYVNAGSNTSTWANVNDVTAYCSDDAKYVSNYMIYAEDIYVGYKYFETRYEDCILNQGKANSTKGSSSNSAWNYPDEVSFPFGYGLSYTNFDQKIDQVDYDSQNDNYEVSVTVTNTGKVTGKSVVQLYAQTPYGDYEKQNHIEKSAVQLAAYTKTKTLKAGESETVKVKVDRYLLASYDTYNTKGYVLSAGDYYLAIGDDAHDALNNILAAKGATGMVDTKGNIVTGNAEKTYEFTNDTLDTDTYSNSKATNTKVTNKFENADINNWIDNAVTYLSRSDWDGTYPAATSISATKDMMKELDNQNYKKASDSDSASKYTQGKNKGITWMQMKDVDYDDEKWDTFLNQLSIKEMCSILPDQNGSVQIQSIALPASYRGDDMDCLEQVTFKANKKSGIVWQSSVLLATTWNKECVAKRASYTGNEAIFMGCTEIWSGGPNFHRNQFCGRNNAYYSEDATLDYLIGEILCKNVQKYGVILGYKHLVLNDQETHRESVATFANEQTIREIYMRAFEGAYSNAGCLGVMTAFNRVGCTYGGSASSVLKDVLRDEWGFKGVVCSDAVVGMNYKTHYAENITSGLDYWCWDMAGFGGPAAATTTKAEVNGNSGTYKAGGTSDKVIEELITKNDDGTLLSALRGAVKNQLYAELKTNLTNGLTKDSKIISVTPWWKNAILYLQIATGLLWLMSFSFYIYKLAKNRKEIRKNGN